jgi:glycosyltransferase involved in cell wall biosynthesis
VDSGGQNIYVAQLARHLARHGHAVDVFTRHDSTTQPEIVDWQPRVRVINVPAGPAAYVPKEELLPAMPDFCSYIRDFARRNGIYDVAHANFFMSGLAALELKRALGVPFVVTFHALGRVRRLHQGDADRFPAQRLAIEDETIKQADAIIAECPQDKVDLTTLYQADVRRVSIIPCGFDREEFFPITKPFARRALGLPVVERIALNIGRLVPRKGLDNAIRGVARLASSHGITAKLVIVGGNLDLPCPIATPEIARLKALAEDEGVGGQVLFTGRRSRELLKLYYSAADVFITTPWYEPFGITPLESMACGTPVIGADVGGIRFSIVDGMTGYLVPPNDSQSLADRMAQLFRNSQCRKELARNALQRVHSHFTWPKVARSIAALYVSVLAGSAPRPEPRFAVAA